jgi:hypothetical protein
MSIGWHSATSSPTFRGRVLTDVPPLNPAKVNSAGFLISDRQASPFRLEITCLKAAPETPNLEQFLPVSEQC